MKVRTSHDTIEDFNRSKIVKALVNEAHAPVRIAEKIAGEVESYLRRIEVEPTTTMIREMVNAKLIEYGFDDIAAYHQRLGLPVYDVNRILSHGDRMDNSTQFNPESIHKHMGDIIARNFALSSVIPPELADGHRRGLMHINALEYFVTRPYCYVHDLRYFLRKGLTVDGTGKDTAVAGPSKHAEVAVFHAAKALAASQVFWAGGQSFNFFNVLMAPHFVGRDEKAASQLCQMFVYEMSQQYVARGGQMVLSSVSLLPGVPECLAALKAIKPGGEVGPETYSDYHDESVRIFRGLMGVLLGGDYTGKPFRFPQVEIRLDPGLITEAEEDYLSACELSARFGSPTFLNLFTDGTSPLDCSVESSLIVDGSEGYPESLRAGVLQEVTLNLPRAAFESGGREGKFLDILADRMNLARRVLLLKRDLIGARMEEGSLTFPSQLHSDMTYMPLDEQHLYVGVIGMNEAVRSLTGEELHASRDAQRLATRTLEWMAGHLDDYCSDTGLRFGLCQSPSMEAASRLASIDRREFRSRFCAQGRVEHGSLYYTTGAQIRASSRTGLRERLRVESQFHRLLTGGAVFDVWLKDGPSADAVLGEALKIARTDVRLFTFTQDLTICLSCGSLSHGLERFCPTCSSAHIDWISRAAGQISRVGLGEGIGGWNPGAREQLLKRRRFRV